MPGDAIRTDDHPCPVFASPGVLNAKDVGESQLEQFKNEKKSHSEIDGMASANELRAGAWRGGTLADHLHQNAVDHDEVHAISPDDAIFIHNRK